ncbi:MAG TPA: MauE/DoxX family redox-associated membrane protein, partial [Elusimicrobiota bacterium]|nr:MauE/DoxX family redox-associated membrane protein [Elusimicrobiota bacterium]
VPLSVALPLAGLLPWLEMLVGWALLLGVETTAASGAALAMFAAFLAALLSVVARGIPIPNCGCFGDAAHFTPLQALLFDSAMGTLSWLSRRAGAGPASLDSWSQRGL